MGEYVLTGSRYVYRDDDEVLVIKRRGDKVSLSPEQEQRLRAGTPGSPFQDEGEHPEETGFEVVAVANEATIPADDDGFTASAPGTANLRRPEPRRPEARDAREAGERDATSPTPTPVTSTESKPSARVKR